MNLEMDSINKVFKSLPGSVIKMRAIAQKSIIKRK